MTEIKLNGAEIQSGLNRIKQAENLILQLPKEHKGRNTWLLNYGTGIEATTLRLQCGLTFDESTQSCEITGTTQLETENETEDIFDQNEITIAGSIFEFKCDIDTISFCQRCDLYDICDSMEVPCTSVQRQDNRGGYFIEKK